MVLVGIWSIFSCAAVDIHRPSNGRCIEQGNGALAIVSSGAIKENCSRDNSCNALAAGIFPAIYAAAAAGDAVSVPKQRDEWLQPSES